MVFALKNNQLGLNIAKGTVDRALYLRTSPINRSSSWLPSIIILGIGLIAGYALGKRDTLCGERVSVKPSPPYVKNSSSIRWR